MDLELERSQHHFGYSVHTQRNMGLWDSQPGSYLLSHIQYCGVVSVFL